MRSCHGTGPASRIAGCCPTSWRTAASSSGANAAVAGLLDSVLKDRLTVVQARSGAGKTSLLNAGLAPHLIEAGRLPIYARPYEDPILAIKRVLASPAQEPWPELLSTLPLPEFLGLACARLEPGDA